MCILNREMRDSFIKGLRVSYAKALSKKMIDNLDDIVFGAQKLYLSGTPFDNRGSKKQPRMEDEDALEIALMPIAKMVLEYFKGEAPHDQNEFNGFHEALCELFLRTFAVAGYAHTYGSAQKFCNILFKYLACYADAEKYAESFRYCHTAIDRYTYNGYRLPFYRDVVYKEVHGRAPRNLTAWSKLTKAEYIEIVSDIVTYTANNPKTFNTYLDICANLQMFTQLQRLSEDEDYVLTPFEAEFFLWAIAKKSQEKDSNKRYIYDIACVKRVRELL